MEPLSFKGRRGSGADSAAGRCAYADASLRLRWDWEKYLETYKVWGRKLHSPDSNIDVEPALAAASRLLPIITSAHLPSAANNNYWPELYTNQSLLEPSQTEYTDTPSPKTFGNTSPLDPQLFSRITDFVDELLGGDRSGKYSPIEVAQWLEDLSAIAQQKPGKTRRVNIDVELQSGLGRFFAAKFRAGVLYGIHARTGDRAALERAIQAYRTARDVWVGLAKTADGTYVSDITFGELPWLRGNWLARLPAIEADIALLEKRLVGATPSDDARLKAAIAEALGRPQRPSIAVNHRAPDYFQRKQPVRLALSARGLTSAMLYYRHVNQADRWQSILMHRGEDAYAAVIASDYTDSPYPLQYYFELKSGPDRAWLHPGFPADLAGQPYYVLRGRV